MKKGIRNLVTVFSLAIVPSFFSMMASAFELSPMESEFTPSPQQNGRTFTIVNNGDRPVAAQVRAFRRTTAPNGGEVRTPTSDFLVFPQQVTLGPKEKRAIRVTWKGPAKITQEQAYRLVAEQLPVSAEPIDSGSPNVKLKYLLKFVASIYVTPEKGAADVALESAAPLDASGRKLQLVFANKGNKHKILKGIRVLFKSQGQVVEVDRQFLKPLESHNLFPGARIGYNVARPFGLPEGPVSVEVRFN